jgi:transposase
VLSFASVRRIFVARSPTDMRRGIDTLSALVAGSLGGDPYAGDCFVFVGRDRRRLKVLLWEDGGFWLCLKRLESGTFAPLPMGDGPTVAMSPAQIHALLEGIDVRDARFRRRCRRSAHGCFVVAESAMKYRRSVDDLTRDERRDHHAANRTGDGPCPERGVGQRERGVGQRERGVGQTERGVGQTG